MKKILNIIALMFFLLFISSCIKECKKNYWLEIPLATSLTTDSIHIGDTIWLESEYDFSLMDINSNMDVNVDSFQMLMELLVSKIDSTWEEGSGNFVFFTTIGELNSFGFTGGETRQLLYDSSTGRNKIRIGIIAKESGLCYFQIFSWFYKYSNVKQEHFSRTVDFDSGSCDENLYITYRTMSDIEDNNFKLLQSSLDEKIRDTPYKDFTNLGGFVVYVVE